MHGQKKTSNSRLWVLGCSRQSVLKFGYIHLSYDNVVIYKIFILLRNILPLPTEGNILAETKKTPQKRPKF